MIVRDLPKKDSNRADEQTHLVNNIRTSQTSVLLTNCGSVVHRIGIGIGTGRWATKSATLVASVALQRTFGVSYKFEHLLHRIIIVW